MADPDIKIERGLILCNSIIHARKWVGVNLEVANRHPPPPKKKTIIVIIK